MNAWKWLLGVVAVGVVGCGPAGQAPGMDPVETNKAEEVWSWSDNPKIFNSALEYTLDALPMQGEAASIPWASSYWPSYQDNINFKWDGANDSPALKYQKAFGGTDVENKVSQYHGIDSFIGDDETHKECAETSECDSKIGAVCAKRTGAEKGRCVPTWYGICHAWAPAAIQVAEPKRPVTRNGVTFKINDLKALITLAYDSAHRNAKRVSLRCEDNNTNGTVVFDQYGRPIEGNGTCRDTNPGTYHVLLANYLGKMKQSFVEDQTFDNEVWNQPVRGYRILEKREVTADEANQLLGATWSGGTTTAKSSTVAKDAWEHQPAITVAAGQNVIVQMWGSGDADLFVNMGAQPTANLYSCRPYLQGSVEECRFTVPEGQTQLFVSANGYAETSEYRLLITVGAKTSTGYVFNANAAKLFYVRSDVDLIVESDSATDGNLAGVISRYTKTNRYEYILEVDAAGKVFGGEWIGESKTKHPDFLWLPTTVPQTSVAGGAITLANVMSLANESVKDNTTPSTDKVVEQTGQVLRGEFKVFGPFQVADGGKLNAVMTGTTGDADLYVSKGSAPTATTYLCRPYLTGSAESCTVDGPGAIYVGVRGYSTTTSAFKLVITYKASGEVPPPPPPADITHLNVSGDVALGEMKVFSLDVPANHRVLVRGNSLQNIDLYLQVGTAPTKTSYLKMTYSTYLTFSSATASKLQIGVYGRAASSFTLKTESGL